MVDSPEVEAKAAVAEQFAMVIAQQEEYGWKAKLLDLDDYVVIFVQLTKPGGRSFVARVRCDDYPEIAPELRFVAAECYDLLSIDVEPAPGFYPTGESIVVAGERGPLPVPCIKGHSDFYAGGWHSGWSNPPAHDHSLYQLIVNLRNAIFFRWS